MSRLYGPVHRSLQDRFDTRRLADNVETRVVLTGIPQEAQGRSSKAETRKCPISTSRASRAGGAGPILTRSMCDIGDSMRCASFRILSVIS
jgi:hypothetical protein